MPHPLTAPLVAFLGRLRFPVLFRIALALLLLSWLLPDPVPLIDEILTALAALILASLRKPEHDPSAAGRLIDGEARRE